jgi:uncharacterized protein
VTDAAGAARAEAREEMESLRTLVIARREELLADSRLLAELGLRLDAANIVDFGPVALSRATAAHKRESSQRQRLEAISRANFAAQARTHAAVVDLIEADSHADLARHLDLILKVQFGLAAGVLALESENAAPEGWRRLAPGQVDLVMGGSGKAVRMGVTPTAAGLFAELAPIIGSAALLRLTIGENRRQGVAAFGAVETDAFAADMGADLVTFLARVIERTAARWPL